MVICGIPAYNEARYIRGIITEARKYVDEVIVVDDGSNDGTAGLAWQAGAIVYSFDSNMGYGVAIQRILNEARNQLFDALVILDADTQHYPEDIPNLVKPILGGYDLAIGKRKANDIPKFRRVGGKVLSIFTHILSGENVIDSQSGFRAYSKKAVDKIQPKEKGMAISSEIVYLASRNKLKITEVSISVRYTEDSSTHNPIAQGFYTLFRVIVMVIKRCFT